VEPTAQLRQVLMNLVINGPKRRGSAGKVF